MGLLLMWDEANSLKAIITCAGSGTRLLPYTKDLPKEMAPIFLRSPDLAVKPILQQIYEDLYLNGIRDFCFITSRTKRAIEDHFTPDVYHGSVDSVLEAFHDMLINSSILWVNQFTPRGFGHAVLTGSPAVTDDRIIVHAGDSCIIPQNGQRQHPLNHLIRSSENPDVEAAFLIRKVSDPQRHGIVEVEREGDHYRVTGAEEKPSNPKSPWGIVPAYFFRRSIFEALKVTPPTINGEIQLTDAIQKIIEQQKNVVAFEISDDIIVDVGTPCSYLESVRRCFPGDGPA